MRQATAKKAVTNKRAKNVNQSIYSIYDSKMTAYNTPFFSHNNQTALRSFEEAVNDENTTINKHPDDYSLWHIGYFNEDSGEIIPEKPHNLGLAREYHRGQKITEAT